MDKNLQKLLVIKDPQKVSEAFVSVVSLNLNLSTFAFSTKFLIIIFSHIGGSCFCLFYCPCSLRAFEAKEVTKWSSRDFVSVIFSMTCLSLTAIKVIL